MRLLPKEAERELSPIRFVQKLEAQNGAQVLSCIKEKKEVLRMCNKDNTVLQYIRYIITCIVIGKLLSVKVKFCS